MLSIQHITILSIAAMALSGCSHRATQLNDIHSRLNATKVAEYHEPTSSADIVTLVRGAAERGMSISISGGRHAMGGQQFARGTVHINTRQYSQVLDFDSERGLITVQSGIQWPELIQWLIDNQQGAPHPWGIHQKQTGADKLSIGGAVSANVHGRGLTMKPFVGDIEWMKLIDHEGRERLLSRTENAELFSLVAGGYGLFGVITEVCLRLVPRIPVERKVELITSEILARRVEERIAEGYLYGDFQFSIDTDSEDFLRAGVFSCYRPTDLSRLPDSDNRRLTQETWHSLYKLAHLDKARAFQVYTDFYLSTDGQLYWSDTLQLSYYATGLDDVIDELTEARAPGSLMITELYVPREDIHPFLESAARAMRETEANVIYGTVRFIEADGESFLAWATRPLASVVMNLRVTHDDGGITAAKKQFRALIDAALALDGSYFLTYHRWARKDQVLQAYPQFPEFLRMKKKYDPDERFQSDWYRHYRAMFAREQSDQRAQ